MSESCSRHADLRAISRTNNPRAVSFLECFFGGGSCNRLRWFVKSEEPQRLRIAAENGHRRNNGES